MSETLPAPGEEKPGPARTEGTPGLAERAAVPRRVAVRATPRSPEGARSVPAADDLYSPDGYGEALLRSLMRAQLGVTVGVLLPAAAVVATYPLLSVLFPGLSRVTVLSVPLSIVVLGFGIYPPLVVLAFLYVRRARRVEERFVSLLRDE